MVVARRQYQLDFVIIWQFFTYPIARSDGGGDIVLTSTVGEEARWERHRDVEPSDRLDKADE